MSQELNIALDETGKVDVIAKIINRASGQEGIDIPLVEASTDAVYVGDVGTLTAGKYTVTYHDTLGFLGSAELFWDGTQEIDLSNIQIDVNVPASTVQGAVGIPTILSDIDGTSKSNDNVLRFLYDERQMPILYLLADYLASQNKLISDVTDAIFVIKEKQTDADGDALYSKFLTDPELIIDLANSSISCLISSYDGLEPVGRYYMTLGIKFLSDIQWREIPSNKHLIEFRQDVLRA